MSIRNSRKRNSRSRGNVPYYFNDGYEEKDNDDISGKSQVSRPRDSYVYYYIIRILIVSSLFFIAYRFLRDRLRRFHSTLSYVDSGMSRLLFI